MCRGPMTHHAALTLDFLGSWTNLGPLSGCPSDQKKAVISGRKGEQKRQERIGNNVCRVSYSSVTMSSLTNDSGSVSQ